MPMYLAFKWSKNHGTRDLQQILRILIPKYKTEHTLRALIPWETQAKSWLGYNISYVTTLNSVVSPPNPTRACFVALSGKNTGRGQL